jgi:putative redox protein
MISFIASFLISNQAKIMTSTLRPKSTIATFKLHSEGTEVAQIVHLDDSQHEISAPNPIAYALSSLISCSQVTAQLVATDLGVKLHRFEFDISADLDTAILVAGATQGNPNFETIAIQAVVETNISDQQFEQLKLETERRCPIFQLFSRSGVTIINHWSIRRSA